METQKSIRSWAVSAFGIQAHPLAIAKRAKEELEELIEVLEHPIPNPACVHEEIADVSTCLMYLAETTGCDLQSAIDLKMAINRSREWVTDGRGNGYHKK